MKDIYVLFSKILKNNITREIIFKKVYIINTLTVETEEYQSIGKKFGVIFSLEYCLDLKWDRLIKKPSALVGNGYQDILFNYFNQLLNISNNNSSSNNEDKSKILFYNARSIKRSLCMAIYKQNLSILRYLIEDIIFKYIEEPSNRKTFFDFGGAFDLMKFALRWSPVQHEIVEYLDSLNGTGNNYWNYKNAFNEVPRYGDIRLLEWFSNRIDSLPSGKPSKANIFDKDSISVVESAAFYNRVDLIEWLLVHRTKDAVSNVLMYAVKGGAIEVLEWLLANPTGLLARCDTRYNFMDLAAKTGQLGVLKLIAKNKLNNLSFTKQAYTYALMLFRLDIIKWLHNYQPEIQINHIDMLKAATNAGKLDILEWTHTNIIKVDQIETKEWSSAIYNAILHEHLDVIKWMQTYRPFDLGNFVDNGILLKCPNHKQPDTLDWVYKNSKSTTLRITSLQNSIEYFLSLCSLPVFYWIMEYLGNEISFTHEAMDSTATNSLEKVKYLHFNRSEGCSPEAINNAAKFCQLDIIKFLYENRSEFNCRPSVLCNVNAIDSAVDGNGSIGKVERVFEVVKWLHFNTDSVCTTKAMDDAASKGYLDIVKWLHENRTEGCTVKAMSNAAWHSHLDIVKWLHFNRTEGCSELTLHESALQSQFEIVQFLYETRGERFYKGVDFTIQKFQGGMRSFIQPSKIKMIEYLQSIQKKEKNDKKETN